MKVRDAAAALQRLNQDMDVRIEVFRTEEIPAAEYEALSAAEKARTARRRSDRAPVRVVLEGPQGG